MARTCSLDCSRRHKARSMCSGVRDPAKYLRLEQLKTPEAFKNDFDLISSLERSMQDARQRLEAADAPEFARSAAAAAGPKPAPDRIEKQRTHAERARRGARAGRWSRGRGFHRSKPRPR